MLNAAELKRHISRSPAFVLDEAQVLANLQPLSALRAASGCKVLYAIKALPLAHLLGLIKPQVDGFSVSSLFEAKLAHEILADQGSIHLTTPGLRPDEFAEMAELCSHISFNSLSQHQRLSGLSAHYSLGLRVNPKLPFAADRRFDPCRPHSKLGVDIESLRNGVPDGIAGLQFHTVFSCRDLVPLQTTVQALRPILERNRQLRWLNLGGGYLYHDIADLEPLAELIAGLRSELAIEVFLEPGKAIVGNAGYLLTTVLDRFVSDGKQVLVLDTSINHHPEVFEYQIRPRLLDEVAEGGQSAILVGSTCLAGDVFGEYRFDRIPEVGEKLVFADVGAYTLIKANRFNGYNLPDVYTWNRTRLDLQKSYEYSDYRRQW
ncbi:carboxynorspermidine decarboxylase [Methylomonas sp. SURF-1]|uniref:Carboxynorspermidine/carboxyspermidine decarboxylase n=1 Tax=Methylomonas aurea TaxID=2952224 RepID=A0ABT1UH62_9GAMM|nr:carboxynorspermidine decarboxylase [Methylomonas sp. SURF-1]MCQ8181574.1 carboxynorspermidine decarboxylase [Methylomonas sp. SURF-1]